MMENIENLDQDFSNNDANILRTVFSEDSLLSADDLLEFEEATRKPRSVVEASVSAAVADRRSATPIGAEGEGKGKKKKKSTYDSHSSNSGDSDFNSDGIPRNIQSTHSRNNIMNTSMIHDDNYDSDSDSSLLIDDHNIIETAKETEVTARGGGGDSTIDYLNETISSIPSQTLLTHTNNTHRLSQHNQNDYDEEDLLVSDNEEENEGMKNLDSPEKESSKSYSNEASYQKKLMMSGQDENQTIYFNHSSSFSQQDHQSQGITPSASAEVETSERDLNVVSSSSSSTLQSNSTATPELQEEEEELEEQDPFTDQKKSRNQLISPFLSARKAKRSISFHPSTSTSSNVISNASFAACRKVSVMVKVIPTSDKDIQDEIPSFMSPNTSAATNKKKEKLRIQSQSNERCLFPLFLEDQLQTGGSTTPKTPTKGEEASSITASSAAADNQIVIVNPNAFGDFISTEVTVAAARAAAILRDIPSEDWTRRYHFDYIDWGFSGSSSSKSGNISNDVMKVIVKDAVSRQISHTIFGYGQQQQQGEGGIKGGRTRTLFSPSWTTGNDDSIQQEQGMLEQILHELTENHPQNKIDLSIFEFLEDESTIKDLYSPSQEITIQEHPDKKGASLPQLLRIPLSGETEQKFDYQDALYEASQNRSLDMQNGYRHCMALIWINETTCIQLVDLACTSSISPQKGDQHKRDSSSIRKSIASLGALLRSLIITYPTSHSTIHTNNITNQTTQNDGISYRETTLTRLLKRNLSNPNTKALFLCTVSPQKEDYEKTLQTLNYAHRLLRKMGHTAQSPYQTTSSSNPNPKSPGVLNQTFSSLHPTFSMNTGTPMVSKEVSKRILENAADAFATQFSGKNEQDVLNQIHSAQKGGQGISSSSHNKKSSQGVKTSLLKVQIRDPRQRLAQLMSTIMKASNTYSSASLAGTPLHETPRRNVIANTPDSYYDMVHNGVDSPTTSTTSSLGFSFTDYSNQLEKIDKIGDDNNNNLSSRKQFDVEKLLERIKILEEELDQLQKQRIKDKKRIEGLQKELTQAIRHIQELQENGSSSDQSNNDQELLGYLKEAEQALADQNKENSELEELLKDKDNTLENLRNQVDDSNQEYNILFQKFETIQNDLRNQERSYGDLIQNLQNQLKELNDEKNQGDQDTQRKNQKLQDELQTIMNEKDALQNQVSDLEKRLKDLSSGLSSEQQSMQELQSLLDKSESLCKNLESEKAKLKAEMEDKDAAHEKELEDLLLEVDQERDSRDEEIRSLKDKVHEGEKSQQALQEEIDEKQKLLDEYEKDLANLQEEKDSTAKELQEERERQKKLLQELEELQELQRKQNEKQLVHISTQTDELPISQEPSLSDNSDENEVIITRLQSQLSEKDSRISQLEADLQTLQERETELQQENETYKESLEGLKEYLESLKSQLEKAQKDLESKNEQVDCEKEKVKDLNFRLDEVEKLRDKILMENRRLKSEQSENVNTSFKLDIALQGERNAKEQELEAERKRREEFEAELQKNQKERNSKEQELEAERKRREELEAELQKDQKERNAKEQELEAERKRREELEAELLQNERDLESALQEYLMKEDSLNKEIDNVEKELTDAIAEAENSTRERDEFEQKSRDLEEELQKARSDLLENTQGGSELVKKLADQIDSLQQEKQASEQIMEHMRELQKRLREEMERKEKELEAERQHRQQVESSAEEVRKNLQSSIEKYIEKERLLRDEIASLKRELLDTKALVDRSKTDSDRDKDDLIETREELEITLMKYNHVKANEENLEDQIESLKKKLEESRTEAEEFQIEKDALEQRLTELTNSLQKARSDLADNLQQDSELCKRLTNDLDQVRREKEVSDKFLEKMKEIQRSLQEKMDSSERELQRERNQKQELEDLIQVLKMENQTYETDLAAAQNELKRIRERNLGLEEKERALVRQIESLKMQLEDTVSQADQENQTYETDLAAAQNELKRIRERNLGLEEKERALVRQIESLKMQLEDTVSQAEQSLRIRLSKFQSDLTALKEEKRSLADELDETKQKLLSAENDLNIELDARRSLDFKIKSLQNQLDAERNLKEDVDDRINRLREEKAALQIQLISFKSKFRDTIGKNASLLSDLKASELSNDALLREKKDLMDKNSNLQRLYDSESNIASKVKKESEKLAHDKTQLQETIDRLLSIKDTLQLKFESMQSDSNRNKSSYEDLLRKMEENEDRERSEKDMMEKLRQENLDLQNRLISERAQARSLEKQNETLHKSLDLSTRENQSLRNDLKESRNIYTQDVEKMQVENELLTKFANTTIEELTGKINGLEARCEQAERALRNEQNERELDSVDRGFWKNQYENYTYMHTSQQTREEEERDQVDESISRLVPDNMEDEFKKLVEAFEDLCSTDTKPDVSTVTVLSSKSKKKPLTSRSNPPKVVPVDHGISPVDVRETIEENERLKSRVNSLERDCAALDEELTLTKQTKDLEILTLSNSLQRDLNEVMKLWSILRNRLKKEKSSNNNDSSVLSPECEVILNILEKKLNQIKENHEKMAINVNSGVQRHLSDSQDGSPSALSSRLEEQMRNMSNQVKHLKNDMIQASSTSNSNENDCKEEKNSDEYKSYLDNLSSQLTVEIGKQTDLRKQIESLDKMLQFEKKDRIDAQSKSKELQHELSKSEGLMADVKSTCSSAQSELRRMQNLVSELRQEKDAVESTSVTDKLLLKKQLRMLNIQLKKSEQNLEETQSKLKAYEKTSHLSMEKISEEFDDVKSAHEQTKAENDNLLRKLVSLQEELGQRVREIEKAHELIKKLKLEKESSSSMQKKNAELIMEITNLKSRLSGAEERLSQAQKDLSEKDRARLLIRSESTRLLANLEDSLKKEQDKNVSIEEKLNALSSENSKLSENLNALKGENTHMESLLMDANHNSDQFEKNANELKELLKRSDSKLRSQEEALSSLRTQLEMERSKIRGLNGKDLIVSSTDDVMNSTCCDLKIERQLRLKAEELAAAIAFKAKERLEERNKIIVDLQMQLSNVKDTKNCEISILQSELSRLLKENKNNTVAIQGSSSHTSVNPLSPYPNLADEQVLKRLSDAGHDDAVEHWKNRISEIEAQQNVLMKDVENYKNENSILRKQMGDVDEHLISKVGNCV